MKTVRVYKSVNYVICEQKLTYLSETDFIEQNLCKFRR